jgi:capsular polysaccharide biosynthesis protein
MELRAYWQLIRRRWLLVVIPTAIVLVVALTTYSRPGSLYNAGIRFIVGQAPSEAASTSDEQRLANWKTSEYIVNTLADWVRGGQFAELVSVQLGEQGHSLPAQSIQSSVASDSTRSMMVLSMTLNDPLVLEEAINAAADVLIAENSAGLPQLGGVPAELVQLDEPIVNQVPAGIIDQLELPVRIAIALAAGIGLALFVDYVDPTVRDRKELETMGLEVVGAIPSSGQTWRRLFSKS